MALYTYDEGADALYVLLAPESEAATERTLELGEDRPRAPRDRYGSELRVPFRSAA